MRAARRRPATAAYAISLTNVSPFHTRTHPTYCARLPLLILLCAPYATLDGARVHGGGRRWLVHVSCDDDVRIDFVAHGEAARCADASQILRDAQLNRNLNAHPVYIARSCRLITTERHILLCNFSGKEMLHTHTWPSTHMPDHITCAECRFFR